MGYFFKKKILSPYWHHSFLSVTAVFRCIHLTMYLITWWEQALVLLIGKNDNTCISLPFWEWSKGERVKQMVLASTTRVSRGLRPSGWGRSGAPQRPEFYSCQGWISELSRHVPLLLYKKCV
jgi:hypothetical protein